MSESARLHAENKLLERYRAQRDALAAEVERLTADRDAWEESSANWQTLYQQQEATIAMNDRDLLIECDSILSLIRYREHSYLSDQTIRDLDVLLPKLRKRTNELATDPEVQG